MAPRKYPASRVKTTPQLGHTSFMSVLVRKTRPEQQAGQRCKTIAFSRRIMVPSYDVEVPCHPARSAKVFTYGSASRGYALFSSCGFWSSKTSELSPG